MSIPRINRWTEEEDAALARECYRQIDGTPSSAKFNAARSICRNRLSLDHPVGAGNSSYTPSTETPQGQEVTFDWNTVADALPNRSNKDCRKRWYNVVSEEFKKGTWNAAEDAMLRSAIHQYGTT